MLADLDRQIHRLHECLSLGAQSGELSRSIVFDVVYICGESMHNSQAIALCLSIFFKREKSVLTFLRKAICKDELHACKVDLLHFLHRFISSAGKSIVTYAADIKDTCLLLFNGDKYSDVRCATFPIITKIIELAATDSVVIARLQLNKLADEYFLALINHSKTTSTIKAQILSTLGVLCRYHPASMTVYASKCMLLFLNTLKTEMTARCHKPDLNVIAGALEGLANYLFNFAADQEDQQQQHRAIFDYARQALLNNTEELNRYAMPKAALDLLARHADKFSELIYADYQDLFDRLAQWAQHKNYDMKKLAYIALDSYYKQLAGMLEKKASSEPEKCKRVFKYFVQHFFKNLRDDIDLKETVIAIKGFGAFAGPCREFMETKDVVHMFNIIVEICERAYFGSRSQASEQNHQQLLEITVTGGSGSEIFDEKIYQLPAFIESLACVCDQIPERLPDGTIVTLERLAVLAVHSYPKLVKRYSRQLAVAVARLFAAVQLRKPTAYPEFVSRVVYQSLVRIFLCRTSYLQERDELDATTANTTSTAANFDDAAAATTTARNSSPHNPTSVDFVYFWSTMLELSDFKELGDAGVHVAERKRLVALVYDELVNSLLRIVRKLDLTAVRCGTGSLTDSEDAAAAAADQVTSNPIAGLRPARPADLEILINLVDFSRQLLTQNQHELFDRWLYKFAKDVVQLSGQHWLISGFYKLNTLCMKIAIKTGYFDSIHELVRHSKLNDNGSWNFSENSVNSGSEEDEDEANENRRVIDTSKATNLSSSSALVFEKISCFQLYKRYVREIHARLKQFKDELLVSSLEFVLALPKELAVQTFPEVFECVQLALELGLNYLPMAEIALSSIEYWLANLGSNKLKPYYSLLLAKFDDYLQLDKARATAHRQHQQQSTQQRLDSALRVNYRGRGRRKLPASMFQSNISSDCGSNTENDGGGEGSSEGGGVALYEHIQLRILRILGQLAGDMSHHLFEAQAGQQVIAWDTVQHLRFYVPFVDIKPAIYFDRFLPRVVHLALTSTHRQTKVNACELLHAIVVYMVGKSVSDPVVVGADRSTDCGGQYQLSKLYHYIYPALFRLACDVDTFARNLFQPLVMQMVHWFTGNRKYESGDTVELLNCIMDSLVDEKDAALRDFSALALKEFLKWSIKHTPPAAAAAAHTDASLSSSASISAINAKSILKRIFSLLTHPNAAKRLGGALAWNALYVIIREEEPLVNRHIFELLYYLVESLALAEKDDPMCGTLEQSKLGLDHVARIIRVKAPLLSQLRPTERNKPPGWSEAVLEVAVRWLMRQCGRIEAECRHKAMELVHNLAGFLDNSVICGGNGDAKAYFAAKYEREGDAYFLAGSLAKQDILKDSLRRYPTLAELAAGAERGSQLSRVHAWLAMLTAPLDCYTWVLSQSLLDARHLFAGGRSCVWRSVQYFVDTVACRDLTALLAHVFDSESSSQSSKKSTSFSLAELAAYRRAKCTALVRLLTFFTVLMDKCGRELFEQQQQPLVPMRTPLWTDNFFACLASICVAPGTIGFDLSDADVHALLPVVTRDFLRLFCRHAPLDTCVRALRDACKRLIDDPDGQAAALVRKLRHATESKLSSTTTASDNAGKHDDATERTLSANDWLSMTQLITGLEQLGEFQLYAMPISLNRLLFDCIYGERKLNHQQRKLSANKVTTGGSFATEAADTLTVGDAKRKLIALCLKLNGSALQQQQRSGGSDGFAISPGVDDYMIEVIDDYLFASDDNSAAITAAAAQATSNKNRKSRAQTVVFYTCYKQELCAALCRRYETLVAYIVEKAARVSFERALVLLVGLIEHVACDRHVRRAQGPRLVRLIYSKWALFADHWQPNSPLEHKTLLVQLLSKCLAIETIPFAISESSPSAADVQWTRPLAQMYATLLVDSATKLHFKCSKLLDLLCFFGEARAQPHACHAHLARFVTQHFPLRSSELRLGSDAYDDYVSAVHKLLSALQLSACAPSPNGGVNVLGNSTASDLLGVIAGVVCREARHVCDEQVRAALAYVARRADPARQLALITAYWESSLHNTNSSSNSNAITYDDRRFYAYDKIVMPLLAHCDKPVFIQFLCANVAFLMTMLDTELRETGYELASSNKRRAFGLVELAYKRLHKDEIFFAGAKLCAAYETSRFGQPKDGKEFTKEVLRKCRKYMCDDVLFSAATAKTDAVGKLRELQRQLHCSAYNCLVALFTRTQTEPKLYQACLFKDDATKREFIFEPLIDEKRVYTFPIELESIQERKSGFISLRNEFKEQQHATSVGIVHHTPHYAASVHASASMQAPLNVVSYLNTQHMYESSLSDELSIFDFTANAKRETSSSSSSLESQAASQEANTSGFPFDAGTGASAPSTTSNSSNTSIELERDDLNEHECMRSFVQLIESLVANKVTPLYESGQVPTDMPVWMQFLHRKCSQSSVDDSVGTNKCCFNVRLFIVRAIVLTERVFRPYARFWYAPLLTFAAASHTDRQQYRQQQHNIIDYFTLDLCVMLLSWYRVSLPSCTDAPLVNRLFASLMCRCYHDNRAVLRNNLELVKTMAECWRGLVRVPAHVLFALLSSSSSASQTEAAKKLTVGIQLFGVVLANGIDAYDYEVTDTSDSALTPLELYRALVRCLANPSKMIHASAAEVAGMLLKRLEVKQTRHAAVVAAEARAAGIAATDRSLNADDDKNENAVYSKQGIAMHQLSQPTDDAAAAAADLDALLAYLFEVFRDLDVSMFITCTHRIQLNYAPIAERCLSKLLFHLPQLYGEFKQMCAECILSAIKLLEDPLLRTHTFTEMLTHRESSLQLVCLRMFHELLHRQSDDELAALLPAVCAFVSHPHAACRYQMLIILIAIYEQRQLKVTGSSSLSSPSALALRIRQLTSDTLLKTLLDDEPGIRLLAQNFWTEKANIPSNTVDRMVLILEQMYSPETEAEYLSYATNLLLERTSHSPDFNRAVYENPLSACTFREYNLSAHWRRRHDMMTPLFIDTLHSLNSASQITYDPSSTSSPYGGGGGALRATQQQQSQLQFMPTQQNHSTSSSSSSSAAPIAAAYNWLTQSTIDTLDPNGAALFFSDLGSGGVCASSQSTLLFSKTARRSPSADQTTSTISRQVPWQSRHLPAAHCRSAGNNSKTEGSGGSSIGSDVVDIDVARLRRRFAKDSNSSIGAGGSVQQQQQRFYARKQLERKGREAELQRQLSQKRAGQVQKYRQYRIGDFPDIQIKYSELIAPLQALAQRDSQVAMLLFEALFAAILAEVAYLKDESESHATIARIESNVNRMLTASDAYHPDFVACMLEIALRHATNFRLDVASVSAACLNSMQQPLGILLLEEYIVCDELVGWLGSSATNQPPCCKRQRMDTAATSEDTNEAALWIELAKLYRSMNDYDSIKGIFLRKQHLTSETTRAGFHFESNSDYHSARKCYIDALAEAAEKRNRQGASSSSSCTDSSRSNQVEEELWQQSALRCCNELTDWRTMFDLATTNGTVSLSELFGADAYSLEHQFPYAFRAKLKLVLQEDEAEQQRHTDLVPFIGKLDAAGKHYLEQTFGHEMALIHLHQKDLNAAKYYAHVAIRKYLHDWAAINKTILQGRLSKLQSLQAIVELNDFLAFVDDTTTSSAMMSGSRSAGGNQLNVRVMSLVDAWSSAMPNAHTDPPCTWDDIITGRCIYYEFIEDKYFADNKKGTTTDDMDMSMSASMYKTTAPGFDDEEEDDEAVDAKDETAAGISAQSANVGPSKRSVLLKLERSKITMKIQFAAAAQTQGNYKLALNKLQQTRTILRSSSKSISQSTTSQVASNGHLADLQIRWMHCYLRTHLARARALNSADEGLAMLINAHALKEIAKYEQQDEYAHRPDLYQDQQLLNAQYCRFLAGALLSPCTARYLANMCGGSNERKRAQLAEYAQTSDLSQLGVTIEAIVHKGVASLRKLDAASAADSLAASLEMATYCDHFLRLVENDERDNSNNECIVLSDNDDNDNDNSYAKPTTKWSMSKIESIKSDFPLIVVEQLLNAMRLGSNEARQRFPRLLQLLELYAPLTRHAFMECSERVPAWMFLGWLSQLTALLDKPASGAAVQLIVERIADEYPQALVYPLKLSLDCIRSSVATGGGPSSANARFIDTLRHKMSALLHLVGQFVAALQQLSTPAMLFKDYRSDMCASLKNRDAFARIYREMYATLLFDPDTAVAASVSDSAAPLPSSIDKVEWGPVRKRFASALKAAFDTELGANGQLSAEAGASEQAMRERLLRLTNRVDEYARTAHDGNLGEFSPWLRNFKRSAARDLELPGQYAAAKCTSKPIAEYHVRIESFDERLRVLSSLRRPKCVTVRGNDQREYRYLVKDGEDQRQDERIETLFDVINGLLRADSRCYQRNLALRTYQVVPVTAKLALIEWLPDTKTLKEVIYEARSEDEAREWEAHPPDLAHARFIQAASDDLVAAAAGNEVRQQQAPSVTDQYGRPYLKYKRDYVCKAFRIIERAVPWDLLRRFVRSMAASAEGYFLLRNQFVMSYAVASACQYVLGIGDRHLSNWMIDLRTARAIPIDFGMAFGHATMNIPVPELVPIRLTRQILKLIAPLEQRGLFEASMLHTLRALRDNNDLLMCIMNVFIKEPSLDWIGSAARIAKRNLNDEQQLQSVGIQYARNRVNSAKSKLDGINPCVITRNDLLEGIHREGKYIRHFVSAVQASDLPDDGETPVPERARLLREHGPKYRLTVEEQVVAIIEQAVDPNLLGRAWTGWQPFV